MRRIFLDLEMNTVSKEHKDIRMVCWQEVIEFGAVALDANNREVDSFRCYVKPEFNDRIAPNITRITGIRTEQVIEADIFATVLEQFLGWAGDNYEIYSWSDSDVIQIQKEMAIKRIPESPASGYLFAHWKDLQKEYDEMMFSERQISLKMAVNNAGLEFQGRAHTALTDARATADLYREMHNGKTLQKINQMLNDGRKPIGTNIGDLIGNLVLATA